jgi:hypothetical protein
VEPEYVPINGVADLGTGDASSNDLTNDMPADQPAMG